VKHPLPRAPADTAPIAKEDWRSGGFGLYLHWPFCQSKCPYCDFNSHVAGKIDQSAWAAAYEQEIDRVATMTGRRVLNSIYFGGGTPSLMRPDTVAAILERAADHWDFANDIEITLEANPGSVDAANFQGYRTAGVNRVSLGMQALDDTDLRMLGRMHTVAEGLRALDIAQGTFDRVSFDLIYARQNQSLESWQKELARAIALGASHMSLYQLTIEQGTVFGERFARGQLLGLPDENQGADFFDVTQDMMEAAGLPAYEVSNHARIGTESRHNMIYWSAGDYAGVGPGAHGRLTLGDTRYATTMQPMPVQWCETAKDRGNLELEPLGEMDCALEYLLMGLRLGSGISLSRLEAMAHASIPAGKLAELSELGMIDLQADTLRVTRKGRPLLNAVIEQLAGAL